MKKILVIVLLLVATVGLLFFFYGPILLHPNEYVFRPGGDGIKNYFTYLYYLKADKGLHFTGMNYPFGEHIVFTDNQPLVALLSQWWQTNFGPVYSYGFAVLNNLMIWSIVPTVLLLYLLLRRNLLPAWPAVIAALLIAFMAPQNFRLTGHYALAYTFVIPLIWYLTLRIQESKRLPLAWFIFLVLSACLVGLLHPYYLAINMLFLGAYALVLFCRDKRRFWRMALMITLAALLPVILFKAWLSATDPILDRPDTPYGFFAYSAEINGVFLPITGPYQQLLENIFHLPPPKGESYAYVGILGLVCFILSLIKFYKQGKRKQWRQIVYPSLPGGLQITFGAGVLILLFSMAIPLKFGLQWALEFLPPLKQFRSIGRFAWIFYYVFSVYVAFYFYRLYRWFRIKRSFTKAYSLSILVLVIWGLETYFNFQANMQVIRNPVAEDYLKTGDNYQAYLQSAGYSPEDFQSILPLPYYTAGSEKFDIMRGNSPYESMRASFNTKLPLNAIMMSRTSTAQTLQQLQLLSSDLIEKTLVSKLPNRKPILLVVTPDSLNPEEKHLIEKAKLIFSNSKVSLYRLTLDSLASTCILQERSYFSTHKHSLFASKNLFLTQHRTDFYLDNFSQQSSASDGLFDAGAMQVPKKEVNLFSGVLPAANDTTLYEISVWIDAKTEQKVTILKVKVLSKEGEELHSEKIDSKLCTEVYGSWVRVKAFVHLQPINHLEVSVSGKDTQADHLVIRPSTLDIYYQNAKGKLMKNNYLLELKEPAI